MEILVIMGIGVAIGHFIFPKRAKTINERLQVACTLVLIFSMGVMLGQRENFLGELATVGWQSFVFFLLPTVLSSCVRVFAHPSLFGNKKGGPQK